jgi:hypothetical protein
MSATPAFCVSALYAIAETLSALHCEITDFGPLHSTLEESEDATKCREFGSAII